MYLLIHPQRLLHELQEEFRAYFPYLKLVFSWKKEGTFTYRILSPEQEYLLRVEDISLIQQNGMIAMEDETILKDIIHDMKSRFGLRIKFLHFSESGWISTYAIRAATLGELNEKGRHSFHILHNVSASAKHLF